MHHPDMPLPPFGFVTIHDDPLPDGIACEAEWAQRCAETGRATAHFWHAPRGIVVPRRYTTLPGWRALDPALVESAFGAVQVRQSGGGLVPQGRGMWNLSLLWPADSAAPIDTDGVYVALCAELAAAFARLGIGATPQPVNGSFCDGRYNLAVRGRKLVGTAQAWRRIAGRPVVLAHAVIVVDANPVELTERANAFEAMLGTGTVYRADALTSVAIEARDLAVEPYLLRAIAERFAVVVEPGASKLPV